MKTILVVDDSPLIRRAIRRLIEPLGFDVVEAGDGAEAIRELEKGTPVDAVFLDVEMPVMDGLSFLREFRGRPELPQVPVVMCTTLNSMGTITEAMQIGANEYVMKPFDQGILSSKLTGIGLVA